MCFFSLTQNPVVGNSCRSHMGEGFLRKACLEGRIANVISGGSKPNGTIHPLAVKVMAEAGVDLSRHQSKSMNVFLNRPVHVVITVCGNADQVCPDYPQQIKKYHWSFDDPSHTTGEIVFVLIVILLQFSAITSRFLLDYHPHHNTLTKILLSSLLISFSYIPFLLSLPHTYHHRHRRRDSGWFSSSTWTHSRSHVRFCQWHSSRQKHQFFQSIETIRRVSIQ